MFMSSFLYVAILLKLLFLSRSFLREYLGSLMSNTMLSENKDNFTPPILTLFFSSLFQRVLGALYWKGVRTIDSSASFLILMGTIHPFLHLGCLSYVAFINLKFVSSSASLSRTFIMKICWSLSKNFSLSTQVSMWFVSFHLVTLLVYWLTYVEPSLRLWNKANFGDLFHTCHHSLKVFYQAFLYLCS